MDDLGMIDLDFAASAEAAPPCGLPWTAISTAGAAELPSPPRPILPVAPQKKGPLARKLH